MEEQARPVLKKRGDICLDDGVKDDATAAADVNDQQGTRGPGLDRKRARVSLCPPQSNPVQNVDSATLDLLEAADREIQKAKRTTAVRKNLEYPYSRSWSGSVATPDVTEAPASQIKTVTESQSTQGDIAPSVLGRTKLPVPTSSSQSDIPDISVREDSDVGMGKRALDESAFKNLDEAEEDEDDVPMDQPVIERPNYEPTIFSPHHLEGDTTEVLGNAPGRNAFALHDEDDNIEHQGGFGGDGLVSNAIIQAVDISCEQSLGKHDKAIHTSEIPPDDIDPQNPSHIHEGNFEKQVEDGKRKQPLRRGKRGAEEASDPLGIPPENCDTETQPHIEQQTVCTRVLRSQNNGKGRKETQSRKKRKELAGRKELEGFGCQWKSDVRRSTRIRSRPLEDWRGEKFVYGRILETMSTVIGIKSYSTGEDGMVALRVKSLVPEHYSDILAQAAKY